MKITFSLSSSFKKWDYFVNGSYDHKRHDEEMVLKFIDLGIIKRSEYYYSSPIMLLKNVHGKKQLNSRRERENATTEAIEPIVPSPLSQEVQNSQLFQPITTRQINSKSNQEKKIKEPKYFK
ncbi:hypothetical protein ACTFIW_005487 [Dictyostelium discoideum]